MNATAIPHIERIAYRHLGDKFLSADLEKMVDELIRRDVEHQSSISAAVQAEREKSRKLEVALRSLIDDITNFPGEFDGDTESVDDARTTLDEVTK